MSRYLLPGLLALGAVGACDAGSREEAAAVPAAEATPADEPRIHAERWPLAEPPLARDPDTEERIAALLARMTLEEKVGQVIQADISAVTPAEVREYNLGSVLNGGNSAPGGDNRAAPAAWLALADRFWDASTDTGDGGVGIPAIWGTDAVHGHSNIVGATIFPHNIGLGMADDPDLMHEIGRVTALEMLTTGLDWTFAPTIAVARNDRWGRTYESYSEDPRIVKAYAPRIIEGIQGRVGTDSFLAKGRMIATAKHYAGDGGTEGGKDQGDTVVPESEFRDVQAAGYPVAVTAGVQVVMASFNSYHGRKMHGYQAMLDEVLVGRMGFDGFVVGDWNGHGQVAGCTATSCATSFNAGLDMFMAPDSWRGLYDSTLAQVRAGEIAMARLDEAVARILRVKFRAGIFTAGRPSSRPHAGEFELLAAPGHRAIARRAVRKSLVLLKNENGVLPLAPDAEVLLAGDGAHDIGKQSGGWTLSWQGTGNLDEHFPNGTSIYEGLAAALAAAGGRASLSEDGSYEERPDVAVVVFGEDPYAETQGDRPNVDYAPNDGIELLERFRAAGIPTVSVFLSGRPLWVNPELNLSDAFVAAWLPGTEGGGVADVLVGSAAGTPRFDFEGRLSFSWPRTAAQADVNVGDENYDPQFAYGYGLTYADGGSVPVLPEDDGLARAIGSTVANLLEFGDPVDEWQLVLEDAGGAGTVTESQGASGDGRLEAAPLDRDMQEDAVALSWSGPATALLTGRTLDLSAEAPEDAALELTYRVASAAPGGIALGVGSAGARGTLDVADAMRRDAGGEWRTARISLACFAARGVDLAAVTEAFSITAERPLSLELATVRIVAGSGDCGL